MTPFTREEAREHCDRMRQHLDAGWQMFIEAYQRRADVALGYPSWEAFCNNELGEIRPSLPVGMRREAVAEMTRAQMPTRAQAAVLGISQTTVVTDQRASEQNRSEPRTVIANNGSVRPVPPRIQAVPAGTEEEAAALMDEAVSLYSGIAADAREVATAVSPVASAHDRLVEALEILSEVPGMLVDTALEDVDREALTIVADKLINIGTTLRDFVNGDREFDMALDAFLER